MDAPAPAVQPQFVMQLQAAAKAMVPVPRQPIPEVSFLATAAEICQTSTANLKSTLSDLEAMGFDNSLQNALLCVKYDGDLVKVVAHLCA